MRPLLKQARYVGMLFQKKKAMDEECLPETRADMGLVESSSPNPTTNSNWNHHQ